MVVMTTTMLIVMMTHSIVKRGKWKGRRGDRLLTRLPTKIGHERDKESGTMR